MSIATIDQTSYDSIFTRMVAGYLSAGLDLIAARQMARDAIAACFTLDDPSLDFQKDYDEAIGDWTR